MVFSKRSVYRNLIRHEEFIGMHPLEDTSAVHIVLVSKDILMVMNLKIGNARGQCYDKASAMAGTKSRAATKLKR